MQLQLLNPSTNAIESRIAVDSVEHARQIVNVYESTTGETHAAVLNGDPRVERDVMCLSAYDGEWHSVGTEFFCR